MNKLTAVAIAAIMGLALGCDKIMGNAGKSAAEVSAILGGSAPEKHAILIVELSKSPDKDTTLIKNALRIGGRLKCGYDSSYTSILKEIDPNFKDFAAADFLGNYTIYPAVLNWISSQGWKFQQKYCINMNSDNEEYFFVK